jgi:hypothetical protein
VTRIVAMARRQVATDHRAERWVSDPGDLLGPVVASYCTGTCFRSQIIFRREVAVETPMGQPGALHDVVDANPIEAMLAKQRPRCMQDLLPVGRRLLARHPHRVTSYFSDCLTIYMIHVINTNR